MGRLSQSDVEKAASDPDGVVRARAAELWETLAGDGALGLPAHQRLVAALSDPDARVVEAACWTLGHLAGRAPAGERGQPDSATRDNQAGNAFAPRDVALALAEVCTTHPNTVCREAAATALGRVGDLAGLDALMHALNDKAPVRRRAVIALASFRASSRRAGEPGRRSVAFRVEGALRQLLEDRDWQVRQAAEDILRR
jgi:HEAT repeat protein